MDWDWEVLKPDLSGQKRITLPTTRADIMHAVRTKKVVDYGLSPSYTWITIPPKILYRLQAAEVWFSMAFELGKDKDIFKLLKITDGKIIHTITEWNDLHNKCVIQSCIHNPIKLCEPDMKPNFKKHIKYNWKDYFFLSFYDVAIRWFAREDFILVSLNDKQWLEAKEILHIEYSIDRDINVSDIDWIPTLTVTYPNPEPTDWEGVLWEIRHTDTFNLKDQKTVKTTKHHKYGEEDVEKK